MVESILRFKGGHPSQNGETNIITECIKRIKPKLKVAVEFGAPIQEFCSNIFHLEKMGWTLHYFDSNPQEPGITKQFITVDNVNDLPKCSVISFDTDGLDWELWQAYNSEPDIVIVEINSSLNPNERYYNPSVGASFATMNALAESKGYFLLCHTGNNLYCLNKHKHLFPDADITFNSSWL